MVRGQFLAPRSAYWLWGVCLGLLFLFWWMVEYAARLRAKLTPNVEVRFLKEGCLVHTPVSMGTINRDGGTEIRQTEGVWIRARVDCISGKGPSVSAAHLIKAKKRVGVGMNKKGEVILDGLILPWANIGQNPANLILAPLHVATSRCQRRDA